jgi:hypothetical protein
VVSGCFGRHGLFHSKGNAALGIALMETWS